MSGLSPRVMLGSQLQDILSFEFVVPISEERPHFSSEQEMSGPSLKKRRSMLVRMYELFKKETSEPGKAAMWQLRTILLNTDHIIRILPAEQTIAALKLQSDFKLLLELSDKASLCKVYFSEGGHANSCIVVGSVDSLASLGRVP
jgi:hypothetical protein